MDEIPKDGSEKESGRRQLTKGPSALRPMGFFIINSITQVTQVTQ
jgi:hypothetical protein